jgi:hypothetical protein
MPTRFHDTPTIDPKVTVGELGTQTDRLVILQACFHFLMKVGKKEMGTAA